MMKNLRLLFLSLFISFAIIFTGCNLGQKEDPKENGTENTTDNNTDKDEPADTPAEEEETKPEEESEPELIIIPSDANSVGMAKLMTIGWNLGNTLDAFDGQGLESETSWEMPETTEAMIKGVKAAGFKTIRIPTSWHNHMDATTLEIDSAWMNRVKTVVDWSINAGLIVILNIHHDNVAEDKITATTYALSKDKDVQTSSINYISKAWTQIATTFKDYDNNLVFEVLNEPRDIDGKVWGSEWYVSGTNATEANTVILTYEQAAVDAIRKTGGKNTDRFLMIPGYAAATDCFEGFTFPTDTATDRIILSVHAYSPYNFAMEMPGDVDFTDSHKAELTKLFDRLKTNYISNGIGVVIGETGATNKKNDEARIEWAGYFFGEAYKRGMPSVLWDNGQDTGSTTEGEKYGYYNRTKQNWYSPDFIEAAMASVGITVKVPGNE